MRIPNSVQLAQPWHIHALVPDFTLEDVWALSAITGDENAFDGVIELAARFDPAHADSLPTRFLWSVRDLLGRLLDLGRISTTAAADDRLPIPETSALSLAGRLPAGLCGTANDVRFDHLPFIPLYRTRDEFAAEMSNKTVHGVMHLAWVHHDGGTYHLQMAVYVKPRGWFGHAYMGFIKPFRYVIVYPALQSQFERAFSGRDTRQ